MEPEALFGQPLLRRRRKQHALRLAQHPVLRQQPVDPLLRVLQGKPSLEVRIKHPMREDHIRLLSPKHAARRKPAILPEPVHDHPIESALIRLEPALQPPTVGIHPLARPQRMDRKWVALQVGSLRMVQRRHLELVPGRRKSNQRTDRLSRSSCLRAHRPDDMQQSHGSY